ncbi:MAG: AtpZ/AtpI family protein [Oceanicaulis sp.]
MSRRDDQIQNASDRDDFERRLEEKLAQRRSESAEKAPSNWSQGVRYGSEFAGGVIAGAALGFLADRFFGWTPWGLLAGVLLGFAAGTLNVVRAAQSMSRDDEVS